MRKSEAKILIYLSQVETRHKYLSRMALKLDIDNSNCCRTLHKMLEKKWIREDRHFQGHKRVFYFVTPEAPIQEAKELMIDG